MKNAEPEIIPPTWMGIQQRQPEKTVELLFEPHEVRLRHEGQGHFIYFDERVEYLPEKITVIQPLNFGTRVLIPLWWAMYCGLIQYTTNEYESRRIAPLFHTDAF